MDQRDADFNRRMLQTFRIEAEEHVRLFTAGLLELEKSSAGTDAGLIEKLFREVHSLKGAARSVNLRDIEALCQPAETIFSHLKSGRCRIDKELCSLLHATMDFVADQIVDLAAGRTAEARKRQKELIRQLKEAAEKLVQDQEANSSAPENSATGEPHSAVNPRPGDTEPPEEPEISHDLQSSIDTCRVFTGQTVRIPVEKLDPLLFQAEEMVQMKVSLQQRLLEIREVRKLVEECRVNCLNQRSGLLKAEEMREIAEKLEMRLDDLSRRITAVAQTSDQDLRSLRRMVDEHLDSMKSVLMLPATSLTEAFPKLVRDLCLYQGKDAEIHISGAEIEIDKRILEELKDPLVHLLRNCVDHGIEKPDCRKLNKKAEKGKICLELTTNESRQFVIALSDDGCGIDAAALIGKAVKKGLISQGEAEKLDRESALALIFKSGLSTSPIITDISGRGLGLAIVQEKVEKLGGTIKVESRKDAGTTFRITLPMSLATFRGVLIEVNEAMFVIPTSYVEKTVRIKQNAIKTVEGRETVMLDGNVMSLTHLDQILDVRSATRERLLLKKTDSRQVFANLVILTAAGSRLALRVDRVVDELQVLVKTLGRQLSRVRNIAGATILGNGRLVPVIHVPDLVISAAMVQTRQKSGEMETAIDGRRILVAEDSITSRTLLKTILENAGFVVTTAVDGADAFSQARTGEFDLLVSDVDMPRMSGFELTARVRADKKLCEMPVVLVTALESREDRERGIDAGADAYIVKSSFDQSNLIEVINKLI